MKSRFYLLFIGLLLGSLLLTSCDKEETIIIPTVSYKYNGWLYVSNGETLTLEVAIDLAKSSQGIYVKQMEFYFDGEKISTSTSAPFQINYLIQNKSIGKHELKIIAKIAGDGYTETTSTITLSVTVMETPFALNFNINYDDEQQQKGEIHNGDILSGNVEINETTSFDATITKIEYYWDEKLIGATSFEPFKFYYQLENESLGIHEFKVVIETSSSQLDTGFTSTIRNKMIVIQ